MASPYKHMGSTLGGVSLKIWIKIPFWLNLVWTILCAHVKIIAWSASLMVQILVIVIPRSPGIYCGNHPIPRVQPEGEVWFSAINPWWPWYKCYISCSWLVHGILSIETISKAPFKQRLEQLEQASLLHYATLRDWTGTNNLHRATDTTKLLTTPVEATGQLWNWVYYRFSFG